MKILTLIPKNNLLISLIFSIFFTIINLPLCLLLSEILAFWGMNTSEPTIVGYNMKEKIIVVGIIAPFFETLITQAFLINLFYILIEKFKILVSEKLIIVAAGIFFSLGHYNGTFEFCFYTIFSGVYLSWFYHLMMKMKGNKIALITTSFVHSFWNLSLVTISYFSENYFKI
jgi:hypothetical protein